MQASQLTLGIGRQVGSDNILRREHQIVRPVHVFAAPHRHTVDSRHGVLGLIGEILAPNRVHAHADPIDLASLREVASIGGRCRVARGGHVGGHEHLRKRRVYVGQLDIDQPAFEPRAEKRMADGHRKNPLLDFHFEQGFSGKDRVIIIG